jgi:hypothetical protein
VPTVGKQSEAPATVPSVVVFVVIFVFVVCNHVLERTAVAEAIITGNASLVGCKTTGTGRVDRGTPGKKGMCQRRSPVVGQVGVEIDTGDDAGETGAAGRIVGALRVALETSLDERLQQLDREREDQSRVSFRGDLGQRLQVDVEFLSAAISVSVCK